jgi:hypothetical protein
MRNKKKVEQPSNTPTKFMRGINTKGRKKGDSSSPPKTIATVVAANPLS